MQPETANAAAIAASIYEYGAELHPLNTHTFELTSNDQTFIISDTQLRTTLSIVRFMNTRDRSTIHIS